VCAKNSRSNIIYIIIDIVVWGVREKGRVEGQRARHGRQGTGKGQSHLCGDPPHDELEGCDIPYGRVEFLIKPVVVDGFVSEPALHLLAEVGERKPPPLLGILLCAVRALERVVVGAAARANLQGRGGE
jgi:hypothetical protein